MSPIDNPIHFVLLRGLGRESGHWPGFIARFSQAFPKDRVEAMDYPGVGYRREEAAPHSVESMAEAILNSCSESSNRLVIVGHSLGGMVALRAMVHQPLRVRGVVVVNTSSRDTSQVQKRMTLSAMKDLTVLMSDRNDKRREAGILSIVSRDPDKQAEVLPVWQRLARERPISAWTITKQLWAASQFEVPKTLPDGRPILCLSSLGDRLVDPECSSLLAQRLKAEHCVHPWAGHELSLDDPDWFIAKVQNWLKQHELRS